MQLLIDFFPLLAFFVSFKLGGIYVATGVLIAATALQIGYHWFRHRKVKALHWITGALVLVFGVATIVLHDPRFIQWKLTVLMGALALGFLVSQFVGAKPLVQRYFESIMSDQIIAVTPAAWRLLNLGWVAFFALIAGANLYVAYHFSQDAWVFFKIWIVTAAMLVFMLPQVFWLIPKETPAAGDKLSKQ